VQTAAALSQSSECFAKAFHDNPTAMAIRRLNDDLFVEVNARFEQLAGYSRAELLGKRVGDFHFYLQPDLREPVLSQAARREPVSDMELDLRAKDGQIKRILMSLTFLTLDRQYCALASVVDITDRHRAEEALKTEEERLASLVDTAMDGIISVDENQTVVLFNKEAETMFGYKASEMIGVRLSRLIPERSRDAHAEQVASFGRSSGGPRMMAQRVSALRANGDEFPIEVSISQTGAPGKKLFTAIIRDISDRKRTEQLIANSLLEKDLLLREMHHRVKNNFQIISSLLHFQAKKAKDADTRAIFDEGRDRLRSMILVHEKLYDSSNLLTVDFGDYARTLVNQLSESYGDSTGRTVQIEVSAATVLLPIETAVPCGMILSELSTNSFKHAFAGRSAGRLRIDATRSNNNFNLVVEDDGVGLPETGRVESPASFGLQLVRNLASQLGAVIDISNTPGARFSVIVPLRSPSRDIE
jgi:PAS domain S-box-containing protein